MAVLEHKERKREREKQIILLTIEVKSKFCSGFFYLLEWWILLKLSDKHLNILTNSELQKKYI